MAFIYLFIGTLMHFEESTLGQSTGQSSSIKYLFCCFYHVSLYKCIYFFIRNGHLSSVNSSGTIPSIDLLMARVHSHIENNPLLQLLPTRCQCHPKMESLWEKREADNCTFSFLSLYCLFCLFCCVEVYFIWNSCISCHGKKKQPDDKQNKIKLIISFIIKVCALLNVSFFVKLRLYTWKQRKKKTRKEKETKNY